MPHRRDHQQDDENENCENGHRSRDEVERTVGTAPSLYEVPAKTMTEMSP